MGLLALIPLYASEVGPPPSVYGFVHGIGLGVAAGSGVAGEVLASRGPGAAWLVVVASYAVAGLGIIVMLLPGPLGFGVGYVLYALNSVGWAPLAALLSAYRYGPRAIVASLSTSVRLGALAGSIVTYTVADDVRTALLTSPALFLASAAPAALSAAAMSGRELRQAPQANGGGRAVPGALGAAAA